MKDSDSRPQGVQTSPMPTAAERKHRTPGPGRHREHCVTPQGLVPSAAHLPAPGTVLSGTKCCLTPRQAPGQVEGGRTPRIILDPQSYEKLG